MSRATTKTTTPNKQRRAIEREKIKQKELNKTGKKARIDRNGKESKILQHPSL